jgi:hypothetical protein
LRRVAALQEGAIPIIREVRGIRYGNLNLRQEGKVVTSHFILQLRQW